MNILEKKQIIQKTNEKIVNLVLHIIDFNKQILIFNSSKNSSEKTAEVICENISKIDNEKELEKISNEIKKSYENPTKQCIKLSECIKKGIAFHHNGLSTKQRYLIEENFKLGYIKIISSTPTLAIGLNLPAYCVIIKDYKRFSKNFGYVDIPVLEYFQMSGRAGRIGLCEEGHSILFVEKENEIERLEKKFIFGKIEDVNSKLSSEPILKNYVLSLISIGIINSKKELFEFFSKSFYAHQYGNMEEIENILNSILIDLKVYNFIIEENDFLIATSLGKKISQLYLNPDTGNLFLKYFDRIEKYFVNMGKTDESIFVFLNLIFYSNEIKPLFRIYENEEKIYEEKSKELEGKLFIKFNPSEYNRDIFLSNLKSCDIFLDWINEFDEAYLSKKYNITPGELYYKLNTLDWLLYCFEEFSNVKKKIFFKKKILKIRKRLKYGIKEELISLINLKGIGKKFSRKIFSLGIKDISDLKKTPKLFLEKHLSKKLIENIFYQIENENIVDEITSFKPLQIIKNNEVSSKEIDSLLENYKLFENDKEIKKIQKFF